MSSYSRPGSCKTRTSLARCRSHCDYQTWKWPAASRPRTIEIDETDRHNNWSNEADWAFRLTRIFRTNSSLGTSEAFLLSVWIRLVHCFDSWYTNFEYLALISCQISAAEGSAQPSRRRPRWLEQAALTALNQTWNISSFLIWNLFLHWLKFVFFRTCAKILSKFFFDYL